MSDQSDDLSDSQSREANRRFRELGDRAKSQNPVYAYAPRWIPTGNWQFLLGEAVVWAIGYGIILAVLIAGLLGIVRCYLVAGSRAPDRFRPRSSPVPTR